MYPQASPKNVLCPAFFSTECSDRSYSGRGVIVNNTQLNQLKAAVARLASSATDQIEYLRKIKTYPSADELALEFHDFALSRLHLQTQCAISSDALSLISALDEKLDSFSGESHSNDWDASALESSRNWAEVRSIAKQLLDALEKSEKREKA